MKKIWVACVAAAILAIGIGGWIFHVHHRANLASISHPAPVRAIGNPKWIASKLGQLPLSFEENRGQFDPRVKFLSRGAGYGLFLSSGQVTIVHHGKAHITDAGDASSPVAALGNSDIVTKSITQLTWLGANPDVQPRAAGLQSGESNYLIDSDPRKWRHHVRHYDRVRLAGLYPGIDLVYHGVQQQVEMDYVVAPHADPKRIQIGVGGPSLVSVDAEGQLSISSAGDEMLLLPPTAYQEKNGRREIVEARYVLAESHRVGFELGAYDHSIPLIIDPVLTFAATLGSGAGYSMTADVAVDSTGNMYLAGTTCDTDYPTTSGAFQTSGGGNVSSACNDAMVTKLNPSGTELLYSTYIGGQTAVDFASRVLVDSGGEATIAGTTTSSDFPTTSGAYQKSLKSGTCTYSFNLKGVPCADAFLLKLSADGSSLIYSTLFGGERIDIAMGLAQDASGNSYVAGLTNSALLPVSAQSYSSTYGGAGNCQNSQVPCFDAFIAKISPDGSQLLASTYLGGNDDDFAGQVALDTSGNVYVTGSADSTNFPTTAGAFQTIHAGGATENRDAFLAKFDSTLHTLQYSTFLGGSADDMSTNLRVDSSGVAYITGSTISSDLPTTTGVYQTTYKGPSAATTSCGSDLDESVEEQPTCGDIFVAKIDPSKTAAAQLVFSTFLGGSGNDFAFNLALDSQKNVWLVGSTNSLDFPLSADAYFTKASSTGLFLSEIKNDGTQLLFSTFLSNVQQSGDALGLGINIDSSDNVYITGKGSVSPTPGAYSGGSDMFLMKFSPGTARPGVLLSATSIAFPTLTTPVGATSAPQSVTLTNSGAATLHLTVALVPGAGVAPPPFSEYDNCGNTLAPAAMCTINAVYQPVTASGNFDGGTIQILSDAPGAPQTITLSSLTGALDSASLVPAALTFNGQAPGTVSPPQTSGINNPATAVSLLPVTTGLPVVTGPNASEFVVNAGAFTNCPVATHQCFLSITFNPAAGDATGTRTATVSVPTNAANSPQTLSLTGNVSTGPFAAISAPSNISGVVGTNPQYTVFITNTGGSALTVTGVTASGANSGDYVLTNQSGCTGYPAFTVASQGLCILNLAFTPGAAGTRTATFTLVDNETTPAVLTLSGYGRAVTGSALALSLFPTPVNGQILFPDTVVGKNSGLVTSSVTILNEGSASGQITSFTLPGADFTQTNTCQAAIPASGSCAFTITFAPTVAGLRTGILTLSTNSPGGQTFTVNFAGTGVQVPTVTVTPSNINFGKQAVGTTTTIAQVATIANSGNGTLNLSNVTLTGPFTDTTTCGANLAANTSCTYSFKFVPTVAGNAGGTLTASTNSVGNSIAIGLNGTGVTGPVAKALPASLTFGSQPINSTSASTPVTFSNAGDTAFTITGVRATENFSETNNCSASLGAGASCTINIAFAPTNDVLVGGNAQTSGDIFITTNAPASPFAIPVIGVATQSTGAASTLSVTASVNPSTLGQSVTFTATVTPTGAGTPTGTVTFFDSATQLGLPVTLSAEKGTLTISSLNQGNHSIFFRYSGDANFAAETSSGILQAVNPAAKATTTTTTLSSVNPSTVNQSVMLTATVASGTAGTITGSVTFFDGTAQIGSPATVSGGSAAISITTLTQGTHSITALYSGDTNYATSTSTAFTQTVNASTTKASTSTSVATSLTPAAPGATVTFTATVTTATGTPTGTVTFFDATTQIGTAATLTAGHASVSTTTLAQGSHSITATYSGDTNFATSTSSAITQVILKATTTVIGSSVNPSVGGQSVTFSATVAAISGTPTGTVTFFDSTTQIGAPVTLTGGSGTISTSALTQASHSISAQYSGDANFAASTSPAITQVVGAASIALASAPPPVVAGQSVPINLTAFAPTGSTLAFTLSCVGAPVKSTCSFSPNPVTPILAGTPVVLTFGTASSNLPPRPSNRTPWPWGTLGISAALAALLAAGMIQSWHAPRRRLAFGMGLVVVTLAAVLVGCAGGYNSGGSTYTGTPKGTNTFTVMGTSTTGTPATTISTQVSVTVQ